jgi:alpha-N-arabinofuranosidase
MWLALTNLDPNRAADIELAGARRQVRARTAQTLVAPKFDSVNTFEAPVR